MTDYLGEGFSIEEPAWESPDTQQGHAHTHTHAHRAEICENTQNSGNGTKSTTPIIGIHFFEASECFMYDIRLSSFEVVSSKCLHVKSLVFLPCTQSWQQTRSLTHIDTDTRSVPHMTTPHVYPSDFHPTHPVCGSILPLFLSVSTWAGINTFSIVAVQGYS